MSEFHRQIEIAPHRPTLVSDNNILTIVRDPVEVLRKPDLLTTRAYSHCATDILCTDVRNFNTHSQR